MPEWVRDALLEMLMQRHCTGNEITEPSVI